MLRKSSLGAPPGIKMFFINNYKQAVILMLVKTEALWLGDSYNNCQLSNIIYFTYDWLKKQELNFEVILKSLRETLYSWQWRNLSLYGKIQIVKTFAIPKFMFWASVISLSKEIVKQVNSIIYKFVWNGKDKIKRLVLISDYENGGL